MTRTVSLLVVCLLSAALLEGCRKKSWTEFYALDGQQQILTARDGDDAYVSDEMTGLITALRAAPAESKEYDQAMKLADRLSAEKQRVERELEAKKTVVVAQPTTNFPPPNTAFVAPPPPPPAVNDAGSADAGPEEPYFGMSEADFVKAFGKCFSAGPASTGPDGGAATTQLAKNESACARFNTPGAETSYVFVKEGLWGSVTKTAPRLEQKVIPPEPARAVSAADAGERILTIPGAPIREGYRAVTDVDGGAP